MTTQEERANLIEKLVYEFGEKIEEIIEKHSDIDERFNTVIQMLYDVFEKACEFEEKGDEVQAVEQFFLCLGMIKQVLESDMFHHRKNKEYLQQILITFDMPCSIKMARIMFQSGNYDQVYDLAERILAIDPKNEEAKDYIKYIKKAERNSEWRRLKDCKDIHEYVREYYKINQEKEEKEKKAQQKKLMKQLDNDRQSDPAKFILQACEFFVKFVMIIPYLVFKKAAEPLIVFAYEQYLLPSYLAFINKVPMSAPVFKIIFSVTNPILRKTTSFIEKMSWKNNESEQEKQRISEVAQQEIDTSLNRIREN